MSQRNSGYDRKEHDFYETPPWATETLLPYIGSDLLAGKTVWEPACGMGRMIDVLQRGLGCSILATDIVDGEEYNFLSSACPDGVGAIITNPPYKFAQQFCEHAVKLMEPCAGTVAMLLRTDFDHAKSRTYLFRDNPAFSRKLVLMKRIVWFVEDDGKPKASPSFNHAWYLWDWRHEGPPSIAYGP